MRRFAAIPAHPQKQYTRRWRLYHFCGFCYPIREVIPIAIYHCNISIVSRGKGKSAVAAAAYRSGEKITNEWDGMTHDYTRKRGVVHTEILLPPHAPPSFSDRATLWNSVELYEKAGNAQLAREIDAALPIELSREEQIRLVREYCSSQFVSRGMCVDFAIHDTDSGNPHCHIMLTMRPLDERGAWAAKSKKEYDLDENGERIRLPSGRYKTHKVDLTGWNNKGNALLWRKAWADISNAYLERAGRPERIDHRSNAERGIDELPTVHMGVAACQMEKKGIATEKGELNRNIQKANRLTLNSRPKQPKYARNKNVIVIGSSGSGKTRFYLKPQLMQMTPNVSYVCTDPKGTIIVECGKMLVNGGYRIKVLNTINFKKSMHYKMYLLLIRHFREDGR